LEKFENYFFYFILFFLNLDFFINKSSIYLFL
jgi:hypothetical protein